jgi:hypothetical protein
MPFLGVAHHTFPYAAGSRRERELVIMRLQRLQTEDLDPGTGGFMELKPRVYHARIIIYKE